MIDVDYRRTGVSADVVRAEFDHEAQAIGATGSATAWAYWLTGYDHGAVLSAEAREDVARSTAELAPLITGLLARHAWELDRAQRHWPVHPLLLIAAFGAPQLLAIGVVLPLLLHFN